MISVDKISKRLVVKRNSVITKNLRFDGKIVAGMNCSFSVSYTHLTLPTN